jgi:hypothetical protein
LNPETDTKQQAKKARSYILGDDRSRPVSDQWWEEVEHMAEELEATNRITLPSDNDCVLQLDTGKLLKMINQMIRSRYAYALNCARSPVELVRSN